MVSSKKKRSSLRFHLRFPYFSPIIRVFSKRSLKKHLQRIQNCMCCFRGGTASFASPNIHHCSHGFHSAHTKEALRGNVAVNNFHTVIIARKAVSTTTFACFRGAPDKGAQFGNHWSRPFKLFDRYYHKKSNAFSSFIFILSQYVYFPDSQESDGETNNT